MQGGSLPAGSTNQRIAGRIFTQSGQNIVYELFPESGNVTVSFHNIAGDELHTQTGGNGMNGSFSAAFTGWVTIKIRNATTANAEQKCYVKVTYTAPQTVDTSSYPIGLSKAIWTGNGGDSDVGNRQNWEEGKFPGSNTSVVISGHSSPAPNFTGTVQVKDVLIESGASLQVDGTLEIFGNYYE
ncbi:MAG: hypothetical protein ACI9XO_002675 [Paraglaciecola sp.]|jgi:hypothetical protein